MGRAGPGKWAPSWRWLMIHLTRLNKQPLMVNSDLIKYVESSPDTLLTLMGGDKIVVREAPEEVLQRVIAFRRQVLQGLVSVGVVSDGSNPSVLDTRKEEK
jgi:flagellar protein FlbD